MTSASHREGLSWGAKLLLALALMLVGAAAASWALARYDQAARVLGVAPAPAPAASAPRPMLAAARLRPVPEQAEGATDERIAELEARLKRVEGAAQQVEGSAGRADALLVAFAARRAIDRGVALGYLEPLLLQRFGQAHPAAVTTIVSGARSPVRLSELIAEYRQLGPQLRSAALEEGWWSEVKHELGSLVSVRRADRPATRPEARYRRALEHLSDGEVDAALAETMRLPGAARAGEWASKARRHVAVHRALDEIESAALLGKGRQNAS
jgi:hypothetical protein